MDALLKRAKRSEKRRTERPNVYKLSGWRSFLYYLYYRNRFYILRNTGMWVLNLVELGLAAWLLGGMQVRGFALANRYVWLIFALWNGVTLAERILVGRYLAAGKPDRIARTIATFIQTAFVAGIAVAVILFFSADALVQLKPDESAWPRILFQHRVILLSIELCSSSLFMGAYTLARMYRPLTLSFSIRFAIILMNVLLFPWCGPVILVITLYLRRLVGIVITVYICRQWVFNRFNIPKIPVFSLPRMDTRILREMLPYALGRALGMLFANGYSVAITQIISWVLPQYVVFYVMFYQSMSLLFMIPRRLGRCVFFDVSHLLIWNRVGVLKEYIKKIDRTALVAGVITAGICLSVVLWGKYLPWSSLSLHFVQLKPLIYAAALFLLFNPSNAVWQCVREASGEIKFNNWLLFITHYCIALPVSIYLLMNSKGARMMVPLESGMEFLVISHSMTLAWVIVVDGITEGLRALLSRFHIFRFRWIYSSPLRITRSIMDAETGVSQSTLIAKGFSYDVSDLWIERYIHGQEKNTVGFPYWGDAVHRFIKNMNHDTHGFGLIRIKPDFRFNDMWRGDFRAYSMIHSSLRPVDYMCDVSHTTLCIFLPYASFDDVKKITGDIFLKCGYYMHECRFAHSDTHNLHSMWSCISWISGRKHEEDENDVHKMMWDSATGLFRTPRVKDVAMYALYKELCECFTLSADTAGYDISACARTHWQTVLARYLGSDIEWYGPDEYGAWPMPPFEDDDQQRCIEKAMSDIEAHLYPFFPRFLRADARYLLPVYFRTNFIGCFYSSSLDSEQQSALVSCFSALYVWVTVYSLQEMNWEDKDGFLIEPLFNERERYAAKVKEQCGMPYAHIEFSAEDKNINVSGIKSQCKERFQTECVCMKKKKTIHVLIEGVSREEARHELHDMSVIG